MEKAAVIDMKDELDKGKAWLPVLGLWTASLVYGASTRSFGVLYEVIRITFDSSETVTSLIGAINIFVVGASAPLVLWLAGRFGYRTIAVSGAILTILGFVSSSIATDVTVWYLTYGVILGLGISMAQLPGYLTVNLNFVKLKSLAVALGGSGGLFAGFVFPQIFTSLVQSIGLMGCLLVMGLVSLPLVLNGIFYRLPGEPVCGTLKLGRCKNEDLQKTRYESQNDLINHNEKHKKESETHNEAIKSLLNEENVPRGDNTYVSLGDSVSLESSEESKSIITKKCSTTFCDFAAITFLLIYLGMHSMAGFLSQFTVAFVVERNMSEEEGAQIMAIGGLGGIVIALISAVFMDLPICRTYRADVANILLMMGGAMLTFTPGVHSYSGQMALAFFRDGFTSVLHVQGVTVSHSVVGKQHTADLFSVATFVSSFGGLTGRLLGGLFYDSTGSYNGAFYTIGLFVAAGCILFQVALIYKRYKKCNHDYETIK